MGVLNVQRCKNSLDISNHGDCNKKIPKSISTRSCQTLPKHK